MLPANWDLLHPSLIPDQMEGVLPAKSDLLPPSFLSSPHQIGATAKWNLPPPSSLPPDQTEVKSPANGNLLPPSSLLSSDQTDGDLNTLNSEMCKHQSCKKPAARRSCYLNSFQPSLIGFSKEPAKQIITPRLFLLAQHHSVLSSRHVAQF